MNLHEFDDELPSRQSYVTPAKQLHPSRRLLFSPKELKSESSLDVYYSLS